MTIGALLVGIALLALVVSLVLRPLSRHDRLDVLTPERNSPPRLEPILAALRDLDFDHQTGKVSEEDYVPARAALLAQAAQAMAEGSGSSLEDELEERGNQGRRRLDLGAAPARTCAHCRGGLLPGDRFCARCGKPQTNACPSCGRTVDAEDRYCVECGRQLQPEAAPAP